MYFTSCSRALIRTDRGRLRQVDTVRRLLIAVAAEYVTPPNSGVGKTHQLLKHGTQLVRYVLGGIARCQIAGALRAQGLRLFHQANRVLQRRLRGIHFGCHQAQIGIDLLSLIQVRSGLQQG